MIVKQPYHTGKEVVLHELKYLNNTEVTKCHHVSFQSGLLNNYNVII